MRILGVILTVLLSGCAHQWTPTEVAALRAKQAAACGRSTAQGGLCKTIWSAAGGAPMPIELQRAIRAPE